MAKPHVQCHGPLTLDLFCWTRAIEIHQRDPKNRLEQGLSLNTVEDLLDSARKAQNKHRHKQSQVGKIYSRIVESLQTYEGTISTMIQHDPAISALVWGAFRAIITVSVEYHETPSWTIQGLDFIARHVGRWQELAQTWGDCVRVQDGMIALYTSTLQFLSLASSTLGRRRIVRLGRAIFARDSQKTVQAIARLEESADTLDAEAKTIESRFMRNALRLVPKAVESLILDSAEAQSTMARLADLTLPAPKPQLPLSGTCRWLFNEERYCDWADSRTARRLVIYGGAGCGKSTLAQAILQKLSQCAERPVLRYLFSASAAGSWEILISFASSLICQLCGPLPGDQRRTAFSIPRAAQAALSHKDSMKDRFEGLWSSVRDALKRLPDFVLLVDGLDEIFDHKRKELDALPKLLDDLSRETSGRLVVLAREDPRLVDMWPASQAVVVDAARIRQDMDLLLEDAFEPVASTDQRRTKLPRRLLPAVREHAHRHMGSSFQWLCTYLGDLDGAIDEDELESNVTAFPATLAEAYTKLDHEGRQGLKPRELDHRQALLRTVIGSTRLLKVDEIASLHRFRKTEWDILIKGLTRPFLSVSDGFVKFSHASVRDFFVEQNCQELNGVRHTSYLDNLTTQLGLAKRTLAVLHRPEFGILDNVKKAILKNIEELGDAALQSSNAWLEPAYDYAAKSWYIHIAELDSPEDELVGMARQFLASSQFVHWAEYVTTADGDNARIARARETLRAWARHTHALNLNNYCVVTYQETSLRFESEANDLLSRWLTLKQLGNYLFMVGNMQLTSAVRKQVVDGLALLLDPDHPLYLRVLSEAAFSCFMNDDMRVALSDFDSLYESLRRVSGADKYVTLRALAYRGQAHYYLRQPKQAIDLLQEAADGCARAIGKYHVNTLTWLWSIAIVHEAQGSDDKALEILHNILAERARGVTGASIDMFSVMLRISIGNISRRQGHAEDTFAQLNLAYQARASVWPKTHYLVVDVALARAAAFWHFDMREEGLAQIHDIEIADDLPSRFQRMCQLTHLTALFAIRQGERGGDEQAITMLRGLSLEADRGQVNRALLWARLDLASLLRRRRKAGDDDEAAALFHNVLQSSEGDPGDDEPDPPRYLDVAERALRFVRRGQASNARQLLNSEGLVWAREEDLWYWVGGPRADTEFIREP